MKILTEYQCEVCGTNYPTAPEAQACERIPVDPKFKVGDIVTAKGGFGWYDGNALWISNPQVRTKNTSGDGPDPVAHERCPNGNANCFDDCCCYRFYYVVTAIDIDPNYLHRPRYHLVTGAMSGNQGYAQGYTFDRNHLTPKLVENPSAELVKDSKQFIGRKAGNLL